MQYVEADRLRKTLRDRIVEALLADHVHNGLLGKGDQLPTVRQLQLRYGVSSCTILSAMAIL